MYNFFLFYSIMKVPKFLNNKNVLYLVIALAVLCSLGYLCVSSYECLAIFVVTYFICCNYIKNKIVCILVALFVSNFVFGCSMSLRGSLFEGYANPGISPVANPLVAGEFNGAIERISRKAGESAAKASANSGGSMATQEEERKEAEETVAKAAVEEFSNF